MTEMKAPLTSLLTLGLIVSSMSAQNFTPPQLLAGLAPSEVCSSDLDNDGDTDLIAAAYGSVVWFENLGSSIFGSAQTIATNTSFAWGVHAADLDGDGDADVLTADWGTAAIGTIAWHENLGGGSFGPAQVITTGAADLRRVVAADLNGDGHTDVLSASGGIGWYQNDGAGGFGSHHFLTSSLDGASTVQAADLDGDGDLDVLAARKGDHKVSWYENLGAGSFGAQQDISSTATNTYGAVASDLDGDSDLDVVFIANNPDKVAWHENLGGGLFGAQQLLATNSTHLRDLVVVDLDVDGDPDVVTASWWDNKVAKLENNGAGVFGPEQVITTAKDTMDVHVDDLDGDGAPDVITSSPFFNTLFWLRNTGQMIWPVTLPGAGADLRLDVQVNNTPSQIGVPPVVAGDTIDALLHSPNGTYNNTPPIMAVQVFPTGAPPSAGMFQFPELHLDLSPAATYPITFIYQSSALPSSGFSTVAVIPPGMVPVSMMLQAVCLAPHTPIGPPPIVGPGNPYFTATDAYEIRIQ
ncbi:MAG: hypothetical protein CMJ90_01970 [Planctomycetes bacterium]|nr:hypothetical protein [Planctomycetota bacterium]